MAINIEELDRDIEMIQKMSISESEIENSRYQTYLKDNKAYALDDAGDFKPDKVMDYMLHKHKDDVTALSYIASELENSRNTRLEYNRIAYAEKVNEEIGPDYYKDHISAQSLLDKDIYSVEKSRHQGKGLDSEVWDIIAKSDPETLARKLSDAMSKGNREHQFDLSKVMASCAASVGNKLAYASSEIPAMEASPAKRFFNKIKNGVSRVLGLNGLKDSDVDKVIKEFARISKEDIKGVNLAEIPRYADKFRPLQNLVDRNSEKEGPVIETKITHNTEKALEKTKELVEHAHVGQDIRKKLEVPPILKKKGHYVGKANTISFDNVDSQKDAMELVRNDRTKAKTTMLATISNVDNIRAFSGGDAEKIQAIQYITQDSEKLLKHNIESIDEKLIQPIRKIIGKDKGALEAFDGVVKRFQDRIDAIEARPKIAHAPNIRRPSSDMGRG
jgi:hypothetical protein